MDSIKEILEKKQSFVLTRPLAKELEKSVSRLAEEGFVRISYPAECCCCGKKCDLFFTVDGDAGEALCLRCGLGQEIPAGFSTGWVGKSATVPAKMRRMKCFEWGI